MWFSLKTVIFNCFRLYAISMLSKRANCYHLFNEFLANSSSLEYPLLGTFRNLLLVYKAQEKLSTMTTLNKRLTAVVQEDSTQLLASVLQNVISDVFNTSVFLNILINTKHEERSSNETSKILSNHQNEIYATVIVAENISSVMTLLSGVCSTAEFRWTRLLHITEWIIITRTVEAVRDLKALAICIDYMTSLVSTSSGVAVVRKSRDPNFMSGRCVKKFWSTDNFRSVFKDLASAKKLGLEKMHIQVAVLDFRNKSSGHPADDAARRYEYFAIALTKIIAASLNFTFSLVVPKDGAYGGVNADQSATGLTGLLVRREAAFCPMGLSKTENRLSAIAFADTQILYEPIYATYRLPTNRNILDTSLVEIVDSEFYLLLLGPLLILVAVGMVTHVLTNACTEAEPRYTNQRLRTLSSFPDHICFHTDTNYTGQTGRVLAGSWGVFWLIFNAAISAFFVTSFTVKSRELKIDNLSKLLHATRYSVGLSGTNSALMHVLATSHDPDQQALWKRILTANGNDPLVFNTDYRSHVHRLISEDYVLLHSFKVADMRLYVEADYSNVRSYTINSFESLAPEFLTFPTNAFYQDQLNRLITNLDESGILLHLGYAYKIYRKEINQKRALECQCPVLTSRIRLIIYITLCNVGLCSLCLVTEIIYGILKKNWFKCQILRK